jgi:high-affinity iron transporter
VVSILIAFLVKSDRRRLLPQVWAGVGGAAVLSVGFAGVLTFTSANLGFRQSELFEAVASVAAVAFVTWMIFWMRAMARRLGGELRAKLEEAINLGPVAVVAMAFVAVAREGLETALLFFSAAQGATTAQPLIGISLGLATSIVLGWGLYAGAIRVNLSKFFLWTGLLLILVAAGIFKYGIHDFQEAGVLPGLNRQAFDLSTALPADAWWTSLMGGMFNLTPRPSVFETIAWLAYAVPVFVLFLWPAKRPAAKSARPQPAS